MAYEEQVCTNEVGGIWSDNALAWDADPDTYAYTSTDPDWTWGDTTGNEFSNIGDSDTILGIEVDVLASGDGGDTCKVELYHPGNADYAAQTYSFSPGSKDTYTVGAADNLWGESWNAASDIKDGDFGVRLTYDAVSKANTMNIYYVTLRVTYATVDQITLTKTAGIRYLLETTVNKTSGIRYFKSTTLTKTSAAVYLIATTIEKTCGLLWLKETIIEKTSGIRYFLSTTIEKTSAIRYVFHTTVEKTSAIRYLLSTTMDKTSATRWLKVQLIDKTSAVRYLASSVVEKTSAARYLLGTTIDKSSAVRWLKEQLIDKTSAIRWLKVQLVDKTSTIRWFKSSALTKTCRITYGAAGGGGGKVLGSKRGTGSRTVHL